jgi:hypothetical protein
MAQKQPNPFVTVDAAGVWAHIPQSNGGTKAFHVSQDAAHVLVAELSEKLETLKEPEVQKKVASTLVGYAIDWWNRRRAAK